MRHILGREGLGILAHFVRSEPLLAFDFDGTLAPIVVQRNEANMRLETRVLLVQVCEGYPCAVISGRSLEDVSSRLEGVPLWRVVGNHGLEPAEDMARFEHVMTELKTQVSESLGRMKGIEVEDKRYSLAIHYRKAARKQEARQVIHDSVEHLDIRVRVIPGKMVVSLLPEDARHKGIALQELQSALGARTAIYVGDDTTDEDVFGLDEPQRLLTIRVGQSRLSRAAFFLRNQHEMDALLRELLRLRSALLPSASAAVGEGA